MEKDEWNDDILGYKGEGAWGLRELLGGEEAFKCIGLEAIRET